MATPTNAASTSVTELGNLPMSSCDDRVDDLVRVLLDLLRGLQRRALPVTTTVVTSCAACLCHREDAAASGAGGVCASAIPLHSRATCAAATDNAVL